MKQKKTALTQGDSEALNAITEPATRGEKLIRALIIFCIIAVVGTILFFGIRFITFTSNLGKAHALLSSVVEAENFKFDAVIADELRSAKISGKLQNDKSAHTHKAKCEIDYGDRKAELLLRTKGDNAYILVNSGTDSMHMATDISLLRILTGGDVTPSDCETLLQGISGAEADFSKMYDYSAFVPAMEKLRNKLSSPATLSGIITLKVNGDNVIMKIDSYELTMCIVKSMKAVFLSDDAYKNVIESIKSEKDVLKTESITAVLTGKGGLMQSLSFKINGESTFSLNISLSELNTQSGSVTGEINIELCKEVKADVALIRILRAGLDTESAYTEAAKSLNAFAEFFSYDIKTGTLVVVYDEHGNDFQYVYGEQYSLTEVEYGDELYNAWTVGGYVALDTGNLDSGKYSVAMYEPAKGKSDDDTDSYNNAYLSALEAFNAITTADYAMTEDAIFVVTENNTEFQFIYQNGDLYDVYEQYYYYVHSNYGTADMSSVRGIPDNVTLYIPNVEVSDK